jgi:hypothetical protein
LVRTVSLTTFCLLALLLFSSPDWMSWPKQSVLGPEGDVGLNTALSPSPFGDLGAGILIADGSPGQPADSPPPQVPFPSPDADELPRVDKALLQNLLDKTEGLSPRSYYHLVDVVAKSRSGLLEQHARRDVRFEHLWSEPERYRGELIYLKGYLRGLKQLEASDNEYFNASGVRELYQGDLITEDSWPNPYVLIMPEIADGMPLGRNITEQASFAGYFLKLWRYTSAGDVERAAPLLIGKLLVWTPSFEQGPDRGGGKILDASIALAAIVLLVMIVGGIWMLNRSNARSRERLPVEPGGVLDDAATRAALAELEREQIPGAVSSGNTEDKTPGEADLRP